MEKPPASLSPTKVNNQMAVHEQKQLWEGFRVHLINFSDVVEQKRRENRCPGREERCLHGACAVPSPSLVLLGAQRKFPSQKEHSSPIKSKSGGEQPDSPAFWGTVQRSHFSLTSPRLAKLRYTEMSKSKEEKAGAVNSSHAAGPTVVYRDLLCRQTADFTTEKGANGQHGCHRSPIGCIALVPQVLLFDRFMVKRQDDVRILGVTRGEAREKGVEGSFK